MKKIIRVFVFVFVIVTVIVTASSCNKWIEEDTEDIYTEDKVDDSDSGAKEYVTGVYSKWIYDMFCWGYFPRMLEFDSDYISGPDWYFNKFGSGNFDGETDLVDALWKGCYGLIGRANHAALMIGQMQNVTPRVKQNCLGELKFQKAFAYFLLVRAYGQIPIQDETGNDNDGQPRSSQEAVFAYITKNLEEAVTLLYANTDSGFETGHVSKGSAAGLLAKVYAFEAAAAMPAGTRIAVKTGPAYEGSGTDKEYADAKVYQCEKQAVSGYEKMDSRKLYEQAAKWAQVVIEGKYGDMNIGTYTLLPYDQLWTKAHCNDSEFLFSVGSVSGNSTYKNSVFTMYEGYRKSTGSDFIAQGGWVGCTRHWYDLFEDQDLRIVEGVKHRWRASDHDQSNLGFYYPDKGEWQTRKDQKLAPYNDGVSYYYSKDYQCLAFTTKYMDVTDNGTQNADANWPFLRLADVYLIYAEAQNELGNHAEAVRFLNLVRERSKATSYSGSEDTDELRSFIIEERAREFGCEADRRWDLIRWGIYLDAMNYMGGSDDGGINKTRESKHLLFPLPKTEIDTNPNINDNNPGWK